jgi:hypothetical protein
MNRFIKYCLLLSFANTLAFSSVGQSNHQPGSLEKNFLNPPAAAKPWVFWYWMHAAVSREGITADLEAMKEVGIGGAYLMPIKDTSSTIPFLPTVRQLSPEWWGMVTFAMQEAKRLDLQLAMHVSDGFALAGGPWISPGLSMQKLVWTKTFLKTGDSRKVQLEQPETNEGYYKDVAVFAYPANFSSPFRDVVLIPKVTSSTGTKAQFLSFPDENNKQSFKSDTACWIQYKYPDPFTCRSIRIHVGGNNYQAQRFTIQSGDDGVNFKTITQLEPPRHGWQDTEQDYTYSIPATTSKYFRFVYDKTGSEPGAEDLDAAKWKPSLKVMGIYLSDEPVINQYEAKNGSVWRVATNTTAQQVSIKDAVALKNIIDLTSKVDTVGNLDWPSVSRNLPTGSPDWVIVRIGHTSTGQTNATAGAGKGLECDKFNARAIKIQFDNWFAKAFKETDSTLAGEILKIFHVDSWECGSQNWSSVFPAEFKQRRGYDLTPYLLTMTGVPVVDAATSEKVLHDVRQTIAELVNDVFYKTLNNLAHEKGCRFSAESVAPTMVSDGLLHYKNVDLPMGEFWLNSPTHDKPNDMLDAISGAHIYGKNVVQAEAFTSVRMNWGEYPGNLKTLGDRNFALGINKMVLHVFTHNPWINRKPGMTLDGVGLYFQRDQTWFKQSKVWVDYLARCQALLQMGKPVVDIAVFTGEEIPRRSVLPDRLVSTLPGIFGKQKLDEENKRLSNVGEPLRQIPDGVSHSANMADPEDWIDPLNGYKYDSFNPDALMMMSVKNGRVVLPGGASYAVLILPAIHPMQPNQTLISLATAKKILQLVNDGANIIINKDYLSGAGLKDNDTMVRAVLKQIFSKANKKGKIIPGIYPDSSFKQFGIDKDLSIVNNDHTLAWMHRQTMEEDIYFIANQEDTKKNAHLSFRVANKNGEIWDPVSGSVSRLTGQEFKNGKANANVELQPGQSLFIIFRKKGLTAGAINKTTTREEIVSVPGKWNLSFYKEYGTDTSFVEDNLESWTENDDPDIKYYSGKVIYKNKFNMADAIRTNVFLELETVNNIATVKINGIPCGTLWTPPYRLDISKAIKKGENSIEIEVANTWHNRLIGDNLLPPEKRITFTTAPFRLKDKPLLPAGLAGEVKVIIR